MDGSGYPRGLRGQEILPETRILSVAEAVEAMLSHRPYRPALPLQKALEEIARQKGILYDAPAVEACVTLFNKKEFKLGS
jgi:HD-GYP domain-containing protein (c-di-GMP phosphodiesterase class II)